MQNTIQKFRQSSIVFEKPGILSENLKTLESSNYPAFQYFLLKHCTHFLLTNIYKRVARIFLFYLGLELLAKIKKDLVSTNSFFTLLLITQDLSKIKKIINSMVVGARQSFKFFIQKTWFLGNNRGLP